MQKKYLLLLLVLTCLLYAGDKKRVTGVDPTFQPPLRNTFDSTQRYSQDATVIGDMRYVTNPPDAISSATSRISLGFSGNYSAAVLLNPALTIPLELDFSHYGTASDSLHIGSPREALVYPTTARAMTGLTYTGPIRARLRAMGQFLNNNDPIAMPWSSTDNPDYLYGTMKQNYRYGFDVAINVPIKRFNLDIFSFNRVVNFDYFNEIDTTKNSGNRTDHDWWIESEAAFKASEYFGFEARYLHKNELAQNNLYDLHFFWLGMTTDLKFGKRFHLFGDISGRVYESQNMADRGYLNSGGVVENLGFSTHLRGIFTLKKRLYIKGDVQLDLSTLMTKMRYDLALRKVWKKQRIDGEIGCWTTPGSLFPRTCGYFASSFGLTERLYLEPQAKLYWQTTASTTEFYRTDLNLELNYRFPEKERRHRLKLLGGVGYQYFQNTPYYSPALQAYFGVKSFI